MCQHLVSFSVIGPPSSIARSTKVVIVLMLILALIYDEANSDTASDESFQHGKRKWEGTFDEGDEFLINDWRDSDYV